MVLHSFYRVPNFVVEIGAEAGPQWLRQVSSVMYFIRGLCKMCCKAVYKAVNKLNLTTWEPFAKKNAAYQFSKIDAFPLS